MYLTRNQAGVYSASGVRIPPSPPDAKKRAPWWGLFFASGDGGLVRTPPGSTTRLAGDSAARPHPAGRGPQRRVNAPATSGAGTLALGAVCGWTGADESAAEFRPPRSGRHGGATAARRARRAARRANPADTVRESSGSIPALRVARRGCERPPALVTRGAG